MSYQRLSTRYAFDGGLSLPGFFFVFIGAIFLLN